MRFSQLIAEARSQRLATIDAEAAETQARVEQAEQDYLRRLGREQESDTPGDQSQPGEARVVDPAKLTAPPSQ